ncbi:MAG: DUF6318 family protein [Actinomycetaceae bacterium]|nr:DUF6318 family protein [Actinomycetaceae bacterium]
MIVKGLRILVGATAVICALGGCSTSEAETEPTPTISYPPASSSTAPSEIPIADELIAQPDNPYPFPLPIPGEHMHENTQQGAEEFAYYYIEQLGYFNNMNDISIMEPLTHEDCTRCWQTYSDVQEQYAEGAWAANLQYVPVKVWDYTRDEETGDIVIIVLVINDEWLSYSKEDSEPVTMPARRAFFQVNVEWNGQWLAKATYAKIEEK